MFSEAGNSFIVDYKNVSHNSNNSCVKGDKNYTRIKHEVAKDTRPGTKDLRKRVNKMGGSIENDLVRKEYHLNNYVSFQDM